MRQTFVKTSSLFGTEHQRVKYDKIMISVTFRNLSGEYFIEK